MLVSKYVKSFHLLRLSREKILSVRIILTRVFLVSYSNMLNLDANSTIVCRSPGINIHGHCCPFYSPENERDDTWNRG